MERHSERKSGDDGEGKEYRPAPEDISEPSGDREPYQAERNQATIAVTQVDDLV